MHETDKRARIAGAVYLLSSIPGFFSLMYVPNAIIVTGDPGATIGNILRSETLFRAGVAGELVGAVGWIFVVRALYRLLADVDREQAWMMAALGLMTVPIMFVNALSELAVLTMLGDPGFGAAFSARQLQELVVVAMRAHGYGFTIAGVFWGLWLFPFAVLVWRSGFLPKVLAVLLSVGGLAWLGSSFTALLAPSFSPAIRPVVSLATAAGELPTIFWLLLAGARPGLRSAAPAASAAPVGGG